MSNVDVKLVDCEHRIPMASQVADTSASNNNSKQPTMQELEEFWSDVPENSGLSSTVENVSKLDVAVSKLATALQEYFAVAGTSPEKQKAVYALLGDCFH